MPDFFAHRFAHTNFAGPVHTLVQIGAQGMQDIEDALRIDPAQIVLTTMDPDLAQKADDALSPWRSASKTAQVDHVAITAKRDAAGAVQVQLYQQPALASRRKPTGLLALFPELIAARPETVPTRAISAFFNALPPMPEDGRHILRFGLTGDEHTLLTALDGKFADRFHDIVISVPPTALFDRAPAGAALLERLHDLGFIPLAQREGPLRDIPEYHFIKSPHHAALKTSLDANRDLQQGQTKQKATIQTLTQEKEALQKALDQVALDVRDLDELRTRYAGLMSDYTAQSEALRQVQARVKAALARFETRPSQHTRTR